LKSLKRCECQLLVQKIPTSLISTLQEAADYQIGSKEKTPFAKTVRTCRQILKTVFAHLEHLYGREEVQFALKCNWHSFSI